MDWIRVGFGRVEVLGKWKSELEETRGSKLTAASGTTAAAGRAVTAVIAVESRKAMRVLASILDDCVGLAIEVDVCDCD